MKKHRGLFLAFGLLGLLGLLPQTAHAGTLTMVVSWSGGSLTITPTSPDVQAGASSDSFNVTTTALNGDLKKAGVNLSFTNLSANTQGAGSTYFPTSGTVNESGTVAYAANGGTHSSVMISTSISGFSAPTGTGIVNSTSSALFTNANAGATQMWSTSYQGATETSHTFTANGTSPQSLNSPTITNNIGAIASGYSLDNSATISLTKGTDVFGVSTVMSAVPEPTSIVLMLTSMPLPLVVMGLIRRRRRAVA